MNKINTRQIGSEQEKLALKYLEHKGYFLIKQNYHFSNQAEIDLIVFQPKLKILVFVEVKSASYNLDNLVFKINKSKQKQIIKAASNFLRSYKGNYNECRFDVIISDNHHNLIKEHIENAFYAN